MSYTVDSPHRPVGIELVATTQHPSGRGWAPAIDALNATVVAADEAGVDFVIVRDDFGSDAGAPGPDALVLLANLAPRTSRIGLVAGIDATSLEPFDVAEGLATLDFDSHGRAGILLQQLDRKVVASRRQRTIADGAAAGADEAEFAEAIRALWRSWEDDAIVRNAVTGQYLDRDRVHHINYSGTHVRVRGPLVSPRSPQGDIPILVDQRPGIDARTLAVADAVLVSSDTEPQDPHGYPPLALARRTADELRSPGWEPPQHQGIIVTVGGPEDLEVLRTAGLLPRDGASAPDEQLQLRDRLAHRNLTAAGAGTR